jgi:general secretion pathway protein N
MSVRHARQARIVAAALWLTVPAWAATSPGIDAPGIANADNPSLNVTQHVMPPPDVTAKEAPPSAVSANPLWAIPMSALAATRGRPLFTPSRRPPAPIVANAPVVAPVRPPPSPPAAPDHPNLELIGTVAWGSDSVAVFIDNSTREAVRLRTGEGHKGWILQSVENRVVTLQKNEQTETLELPKPTAQPATPPAIFALPPPPPPPPPRQAPPQPHADAAPAGRQPLAVGCMPEPVGC